MPFLYLRLKEPGYTSCVKNTIFL